MKQEMLSKRAASVIAISNEVLAIVLEKAQFDLLLHSDFHKA
jgi:hypothetical protein